MVRACRLQRYQKFLKTLRRSDPKLCFCPVHVHPRPWVPPPCRTTKPYGVPREDRSPIIRRMEEDQDSQGSVQYLYNEARILKEALHKIHHGDQLSKDAYNTVKKWSKTRLPEAEDILERSRQRRERRRSGESGKRMRDKDAAREEEELRAELRNLRELSQSNASLLQENKTLIRKVQRLQQRIKRQEAAVKGGSGDSMVAPVPEGGLRDDYIILSLKKKYDDLLQYVLKVESENQKLRSVGGVSGDGEGGWYQDSDRDQRDCHHQCGPRSPPHPQPQENIAQAGNKEEYNHNVVEPEHQQNPSPPKSPREASVEAAGGEGQRADLTNHLATLEEEWTRRLIHTKDMYDHEIQAYQEKIQHLQAQMDSMDQYNKAQVQELTEKLERESKRHAHRGEGRSDSDIDKRNKDHERQRNIEAMSSSDVESKRRDDDKRQSNNDKEDISSRNEEGKSKNGDEVRGSTKHNTEQEADRADESEPDGTEKCDRKKKATSKSDESEAQRPGSAQKENGESKSRNTQGGNALRENSRNKNRNTQEKNTDNISQQSLSMLDVEKYKEALDLIVQRLESLQIGGSEIDTTLAIIKETISSCLKGWSEGFHHEQGQQRSDVDRLMAEREELQKKLQGRNKKLESLHKKNSELEQENKKLLRKLSLAETQIAAAESSNKLDVMQGLPQKLQETEQALITSQDHLCTAKAEMQTLHDQTQHLKEKLAKKEFKLKSEREQNAGREEEMAALQTEATSLRHQAEEVERELALLRQQMATKDAILEHTSAQLDERIRECARLSSQREHYKLKQEQEAGRLQIHLQDQDSASHKQFLEAQTQASRYQAQLSALRSEKEQNEKSLRCQIRKLEEQVDQLQLRNSTQQRQLNTITSTFHSMFSTVDLHHPPSPGLPGSSGI